jgi:phenylpropionate dioxygenase-like ring-hydroxylating dioxygenase large terminal subunit
MFYGIDKGKLGLAPIAIDTWAGFIFINLDPQPKEPLSEFLGELGEQHKHYPFHEMSLCYAYQAELSANWKLAIDASTETYHLATLHGSTVKDVFTNRTNPHGRPIDVKLWKRHRYYATFANTQYTPKPIEALVYRYSALALQTSSSSRLPPGLNSRQLPSWGADVPVLFPNLAMALLPDSYLMLYAWPLAVDRMLWDVRIYMRPAQTPAEAFAREYSRCQTFNIFLEDAACMEAVYAGMRSRAKTHLVLQDGEVLLRHFYKAVEEHVR